MAQLMPRSAAEAVANGAQLLDEKSPGWWRVIDLNGLDLANCGSCICGQLAYQAYKKLDDEVSVITRYLKYLNSLLGTGYTKAYTNTHNRKDVAYGFNAPRGERWTYEDLDLEWKRAIIARNAADALPQHQVESPQEAECALT